MHIVFWIFFASAVVSAAMCILRRNPVSAAMWLVSTMFSLAGIFVIMDAPFLAAIQVLVYAGAVMVLFLFVIMLVNVGAEERGRDEIFNNQRQVTASLIFCFILVGGVLYSVNRGYAGLQAKQTTPPEVIAAQQATKEQSYATSGTGSSKITGDSQSLGNSLYRYASLPFEIASVLLLVAIIGSVMLARTIRQEASADDVAPDVLKDEIARDPELAKVEPRLE